MASFEPAPETAPAGWNLAHNSEIRSGAPVNPATAGCLPGIITCTAENVSSAMSLCLRINCVAIQCPYFASSSNTLGIASCMLWNAPIVQVLTASRNQTSTYVLSPIVPSETTTTIPSVAASPLSILAPASSAAAKTTTVTVKTTSTASSQPVNDAGKTSTQQDMNIPLIAGISGAVFFVAVCVVVGLILLIKRRSKRASVNPARMPPTKINVKNAIAAKSPVSSSPSPVPSSVFSTVRPAINQKLSIRTTSIFSSTETTRASGFGGIIPTPEPEEIYTVVFEYSPQRDDEMQLNIREKVSVEQKFIDGWCRATNLNNGKTGIVPMTSLKLEK